MTTVKYRSAGVFLLAFILWCSTSLAEDKNGVSPNSISLPSGPGSIEGLGEAFQPMLNTGSARYSVKVALPPGTAGHAPDLSLQYDSGLGVSPISLGWSFGPGSISRQTDKGIPRYTDSNNGQDDDFDLIIDEADELDIFIGPNGEELVQVETDIFRSRIEDGFVRYRRTGDSWEVDLKNGTMVTFGSSDTSRITDAQKERIFRWLPEQSTDSNGNTITYSWFSFHNSDNQKYLNEIRYGAGPSPWNTFYFVKFNYEPRPDWRKDFRSGFLVRTAHRLASIDIGIQGQAPAQCVQGDWNSDTTPDYLIGRYTLHYESSSPNTEQLTRVTRIGADGTTSLPPISFDYSAFIPQQNLSATQALIPSTNTPSTVMDSELVELIDLNRDGLTDILKTDFTGNTHLAYINLGISPGSSSLTWADPISMTSQDGLALNLHLSEDLVSLADMNGDGISDLVHSTGTDVFWYANKGSSAWGNRIQMSLQDTAPPAPFTSKSINQSDMDFDKRTDIVKSTENGYSIWFNLEEGIYSREVRTAGASYLGQTMLFDTTGSHLADINGDRLNDVSRIRPTLVVYAANMGHGDFVPAVEIAIPDTTLTDSVDGQIKRAKLSDINGDGLADLLVERAIPGELWFWLNMGTDTFSSRYTITDMPTLFSESTVTRWADMNGNGTTDLVYADSSATDRLRILDIGLLIGGSDHPNLLSAIDNGIGLTTTINYQTSTDFYLQAREDNEEWQSTVPFPVSVIASVSTTAGLDQDGIPGVDSYEKRYKYRDGFYDDLEKEFRGFEQVTVSETGNSESETLVTQHQFFTGGPDLEDNDGDGSTDEISTGNYREEEALKGMIKSLEIRSGDNTLFHKEINSWKIRNLLLTTDNTEVRYAYNEQTDKEIYEGTDTPVSLRSSFEYDDYGNLTRQLNMGRLDGTWDDERLTRSAWSAAEEANRNLWILDRLVEQIVSDENEVMVASSRNYYDNLTLGLLSKGNLTAAEQWVSGSDWLTSIKNDYDQYGNVIAIYDGLHGIEPGHYRQLIYDNDLHTFPIQEIIHTGNAQVPSLTVSATYNYGLGTLSSSTGFNGHETSYSHDPLGRLTAITKPGDTLPTQGYDYVMAHALGSGQVINWVETRARESVGGGTVDSRIFYDGMGRKIMTRSEGEDPGQVVISDTAIYNKRQLMQKNYLPYFEEGATLDYVDPSYHTGYTEHFFDAPGREIRANQPIGQEGVSYSTIDYLPLSRIVRDEEQTATGIHNGCGMRYIEDGLTDTDGKPRLRQVFEIVKLSDIGEPLGNTVEWQTSYTYNLLDQLTGYTDSQNNQKIIQYDGLGRKTFMNDPDRGQMFYEYDQVGNLTRTTDAKSQVIRYSYDGANRLLAEYYGAATPNPDVEYHYDQSSGPLDRGPWWKGGQAEEIATALLDQNYNPTHDLNSDSVVDVADVVTAARALTGADPVTSENPLGMLAWVKDLSGEEHNSYDERGRVNWTVKQIDSNTGLTNFYTAMEYDSMDRVTDLTYPDGSQVSYTFNNRGFLESVPGIINGYDYNPTGQNKRLSLNPEISTNYSYDHRLRLSRLNSQRGRDSLALQDLTYSYDRISNISAITDNRSQNTLEAMGRELGLDTTTATAFNSSQSFVYDSLYRLTQATNPAIYGTVNYRYDRIGNMVQKDANLLNPDLLMDLGGMSSGGSTGTWNRIGRASGDQPGPHAVTATTKGPTGPLAFSYDDNGNMTTNHGMTLNWDFKDRLTGMTKSGRAATYHYDYTNTRKKKTVTSLPDGNYTAFYVDKFSELRDNKLIKYVYAGNSRIGRMENNGPAPVAYYLHDHLGSTSLTIKPTGMVTEQMVNYPFGRERLASKSHPETVLADYRFTGKETDIESELQYFEARYYDPVVGSFISVDPLVDVVRNQTQENNLYSYVSCNPEVFIDPSGEFLLLPAAVAATKATAVVGLKILIEAAKGELKSRVKKDTGWTSPQEKDLMKINDELRSLEKAKSNYKDIIHKETNKIKKLKNEHDRKLLNAYQEFGEGEKKIYNNLNEKIRKGLEEYDLLIKKSLDTIETNEKATAEIDKNILEKQREYEFAEMGKRLIDSVD